MKWRDTLFFGLKSKLSKEQEIYLDAIENNQITFCNARSGSGKTTLAVGMAKLLDKGLVYIFATPQEKTLGFRKGNTQEKESDYLTPLYDALVEIGEIPEKVIISENNIDNIKNGSAWVKATSATFLRGTNLKNTTIILDESQNHSIADLKKILTRIHDSCTVIVIGHSGQIDIKPSASGFTKYLEHFRTEPYCAVVELTINFRGKLATRADSLGETNGYERERGNTERVRNSGESTDEGTLQVR